MTPPRCEPPLRSPAARRGRRGLVSLLGLVLLALVRPAGALEHQPPDFTPEGLAARFAVVREAVEAVLGEPLGAEVVLRVVDTDAMAALLTEEMQHTLGALEGGPRGQELARTCEQAGHNLARMVLAKVTFAGGELWLQPDAFKTLSGLAPEWAGVNTQGFLEIIMAHEATHVWQHRRDALQNLAGQPRTQDALRARQAVIEGHAQWVARRAAARMGLVTEFELLRAVNTTVPPSVTDPAMRLMFETQLSQMAFPYLEGEAFVAHVLEQLGQAGGTERLLRQPPDSVRDVSHPSDYLRPPQDALDLAPLLQRCAALLPEGFATRQVVPLPEATLRQVFAMLGPGPSGQAVACTRDTQALVAASGRPGHQVTVALIRCRDPERAREFLGWEERLLRRRDEAFGPRSGGAITIAEAAYRPLELGQGGILSTKRLQLPGGQGGTVRTAVWIQGEFVVEASVSLAPVDEARLLELAAAVDRAVALLGPW